MGIEWIERIDVVCMRGEGWGVATSFPRKAERMLASARSSCSDWTSNALVDVGSPICTSLNPKLDVTVAISP